MKRLIVIIVSVLLVACAGISIKPKQDVLTMAQQSILSGAGFMVAENNPDKIDDMIGWYEAFLNLEELVDVQEKYQEGISKLNNAISDKPFLQLQLKNIMSSFEITVEGPTVPDELERYREIVDYFMFGVASASS